MSVLSFKILKILYNDDENKILIFVYAFTAFDARNICMRLYKETLKGELPRIPTILN